MATKLVNELVEAADDMVLTKTIARYGRVDPLFAQALGTSPDDARFRYDPDPPIADSQWPHEH